MRSIRLLSSVLMLLVGILALSVPVAAQDLASPVAAESPNDLNLPGIDSQLLGTGTSIASPSVTPRMILERIDLPPGASLPAHTSAGPELLVVEFGTPALTDSFGFTGQIAPGGTFFEAGAQYTLSNPGTDAATALRLSLAPGTDAALASPVAAEATVIVLIDSPLDDPRLSEPTLSIAKLTWHPDAEPQVLDHDAAIGLVVVDGTLFAKSPSGFDGQLAPNTPVVFPSSTPLIAYAGDEVPATALIVTITDGATQIVSAPEPTPTPIPTATPTVEPSITPTPTQTPVPTETPIPTNTPTPTETLVPTETPTEAPSPTPTSSPTPLPLLQNHGTLAQGDGRLTVEVRFATGCFQSSGPWLCREDAIVVFFLYSNMGNSRQDFVISPLTMSASDDNGNSFEVYDTADGKAQRVIVEPGADLEWVLVFENPHVDGNFLLKISDFGGIQSANWGFTISQGEIVPLSEDTPGLSQSASISQSSAQVESEQQAAMSTSSEVASLPVSINSLVVSERGTRSQSEITSTFPNPSEADALFTQWGWSGSNYGVFIAPSGTVGDDGVFKVDIGIHQFAGIREAEEALQYFRVARIDLLGLWDTEVDPIGNMSRALIGPSGEGGYEASVYVAVGSQVIRVTAFSWNDYPLASAVAIMRQAVRV